MAGRDALLTGAQHQGGGESWQLVILPQDMAAASGTIGSISGPVKLRNIVGSVATVIATTTTVRWFIGATSITASTTITTLTTLTMILRQDVLASPFLAIATNTASLYALLTPLEIIAGCPGSVTTINASLSASGTGVIRWALEWMPLSQGATITPAQVA